MDNVAKIAFLTNLAYYEACVGLKDNVDINNVDFDRYAYFELVRVPASIDFGSTRKALENPNYRVKEFRKYLCFYTSDNLAIHEKKEAKATGYSAVIDCLRKYNIDANIRMSYRE